MKNHTLKKWFIGFFILFSNHIPLAFAQPFPSEKPITLIVGFSPGSSIDLVARTFAKSLTVKSPRNLLRELNLMAIHY